MGGCRSAVGSAVQHPGAARGGGERAANQCAVGVGYMSGEGFTLMNDRSATKALQQCLRLCENQQLLPCAQAMHVGLRYKALSLLQLPSLNQKRASALVRAHAAGQPLPGEWLLYLGVKVTSWDRPLHSFAPVTHEHWPCQRRAVTHQV